MKKIALFALAALAFTACNKEVEGPVEAPLAKTHTVTITAGFDAETKTAYDAQGKFSWVEGDKIGVLVSNGETTKQVTFTTAESGAVVTFAGEVEEGFEVQDLASYPFTQVQDGYAVNDLAWDAAKGGWRLWGSIKPSLESPLSSLPLLGKKTESGHFAFKTATGVVKFTVQNVPAATAYGYMEIPNEAEGYLNGWFSLDDDCYLKMSNPVEGYKDRYNWNVPTGYNTTMDYYFFIPEGTLPAGTKFELCNASWAAIKSFELKQPVEVKRNIVTNVAPVEIEPVTVYNLEDIVGEYSMTASEAANWFTPSYQKVGNVTFERSDDAEKGNVMITQFAGVKGKAYGTFDGVALVFPFDQIFGDNPFGNNADYPKIALVANTGYGNVDIQFDVTAANQIEFIAASAYLNVGLRPTTEESWTSEGSFNGAWPWAVGFHSIKLNPVLPEAWTSLGKAKFIDNYVWNDLGLALKPVEVELFSDTNHPGNYKMANPYSAAVSVDGSVVEGADEFFFFSIEEDNQITYERVATGLSLSTNPEAKWDMVSGFTVAGYGHTFDYVVTTDAEGKPGLVNLGPCYQDGTNEIGKDHEFGVIQFAFPGFDFVQKVALTADQVTVSADQNVGGSYSDGTGAAGLVDNDLSTYWHTPWEFIDTNANPVYGQFVEIKLDAALGGKLVFNYCTRAANQNGSPAVVVIGGSKDGENWTVLSTVELGYMVKVQDKVNTFVGLPAFDAAEYTYLRFGIAKNKKGEDLREVATAADQKFTYLSELMLLQVPAAADDGGSGIPDYDPITGFEW